MAQLSPFLPELSEAAIEVSSGAVTCLKAQQGQVCFQAHSGDIDWIQFPMGYSPEVLVFFMSHWPEISLGSLPSCLRIGQPMIRQMALLE